MRLIRSPAICNVADSRHKKILWGYNVGLEMQMKLLLDQAGMAGYTLPTAGVVNPGVSEAAHMIVGFAAIRTLHMICASDYCRIPEEVHLHVLDVGQGGLKLRIFDINEESLLVTYFAIPLCIYETAGNQGIEGGRVPVDLRFIPEALENQQFRFPWIGLLGSSEPNG